MKRPSLRRQDIDADRFWSKVDRRGANDCWLWQAYCDKDGYGYFTVNKAARKAHRVSYVLAHGDLDPAQDICHSCDTPGCVNPAHLWAGTNRDNIDDMVEKGRSLRGLANPKAKLTPQQVRRIRELSATGWLQKEIAVYVGCNRRTVSAIIHGHQWRCVPREQ